MRYIRFVWYKYIFVHFYTLSNYKWLVWNESLCRLCCTVGCVVTLHILCSQLCLMYMSFSF